MNSRKKVDPRILIILIFAIGVFARVWSFGRIPPGLNQDEASIGVEAYNILHFGTDRFGLSYPVNFISWGSGQNALYAYFLIPFIAIGGLSSFTVRLPMLITGILSLPLSYYAAKRIFNARFGLIAMYLLSICPWHIMMSRWGLESNILPFVFLLGFVCLLKIDSGYGWFILSCVFFSLCLYAYGTAYVAIPVFLLIVVFSAYKQKKMNKIQLLIGILVFLIIAIPIGLLILINTLHFSTLHLGPFTIPRYPYPPRYEMMSIGFYGKGLNNLFHNLATFFNLLLTQDDGLIWNSFSPFGYFYTITFPLAIIGLFQLVKERNSKKQFEISLLIGWLVSCLLVGALQEVNINRINLIFIPILLCISVCFEYLMRKKRIVFVIVMVCFLMGFSIFEWQYLSRAYTSLAEEPFFSGLLPALDFARQQGSFPICMTNQVNEPFIFTMFSERMKDKLYSDEVINLNPSAPSVYSYGRYAFGLKNCPNNSNTIYVLRNESIPENDIHYQVREFDSFRVLIPID